MKYRTIGATCVGKKHAENQDRIVRRELLTEEAGPRACLVAVVDGVSASPLAASVARWIASHLENDEIVDDTLGEVSQQIIAYLARLHQRFCGEFEDFEEMLESAASLSLAVVEEDATHVLWAGDSPVYVTECCEKTYKSSRVSRPHVGSKDSITKCFCGNSAFEFDYHEVEIRPGDIVTITSDGAVHEETMLNELYQNEDFGERICEEVLELALRHPFSPTPIPCPRQLSLGRFMNRSDPTTSAAMWKRLGVFLPAECPSKCSRTT